MGFNQPNDGDCDCFWVLTNQIVDLRCLFMGFLTNHVFDVIEIVHEIQCDDVLPPVSVTWLAKSLCVNIFFPAN